jgi:hypothetical protein
MSQEANINWLVNGSVARRFPNITSGSINESGNIVYTLTIPAEPQYNGTEVVCLAVFTITDFEATPTATIFFSSPNSPTMVPGKFYLVSKCTEGIIIIAKQQISIWFPLL